MTGTPRPAEPIPPPSAEGMLSGLNLYLILLTRAQIGLDKTPADGLALAVGELARARRHVERGRRVRPVAYDARFAAAVDGIDGWLRVVAPVIAEDVAELLPASESARQAMVRRTWLQLAAIFHEAGDEAEHMAQA